MPLNKQRGNMYSWVTHTWNPLGGACPHQCSYCSTRALCARHKTLHDKYTGDPRLIEKELKYSHGAGKTIFVCNMVDLLADAVPEAYIDAIMAVCRRHMGNTYLLQTKNPERFISLPKQGVPPWLYYPENVIFGTTIETNRDTRGISSAPHATDRARSMYEVQRTMTKKTITVTIEPIIDFDLDIFVDMIWRIHPDFVSVGANSSRKINLIDPDGQEVQKLLLKLAEFTEIRAKSNLARLLP